MNIIEKTYSEILNKQRSIVRLFPSFFDRVKKVKDNGGAKLVEQEKGLWTFSVASGSDKSKKYTIRIKWEDIPEQIKHSAFDLQNWTKDREHLNLLKVASYVMYHADMKVSSDCLTGDTLIPLLDGRILTINELFNEFKNNKNIYLYSCDKNGDFRPGKLLNVINKGNENIILKITLDNGKEIKCTYNQPILNRNGSYILANNLKVNDSLMPLYLENIQINKNTSNYIKIKLNSKTKKNGNPIFKSVHTIVAETIHGDEKDERTNDLVNSNIERCLVVHHIDYNKNNNHPNNLYWMGQIEHWFYHAYIWTEPLRNALKLCYESVEWHKKISNVHKNTSKKLKELNPNYLKNWITAGINSRNAVNRSEEGRNNISLRNKELWNDENHRNKRIISIKNSMTTDRNKNQSDYKKQWFLENPDKKEQCILNAKKLKRNKEQGNDGNPISSSIGRIFNTILFLEKNNIELTKNNFKNNCKSNMKCDSVFESFEDAIKWYKLSKGTHVKYSITEECKEYVKKLNRKNCEIRCKCCNTVFITSRSKPHIFCSRDCYKIYKNNKLFNHKIIKIEKININEDVFDLTVEKYHNFAIDAGIFVHNSPSDQFWGSNYTRTRRGTELDNPEDRKPKERNPKEYGEMGKHLQNVFDVLPFLVNTLASHLKKYYLKDLQKIEKEVYGERFKALTTKSGKKAAAQDTPNDTGDIKK